MLTRERESSKRLHSGFERNLPGYDRTPNAAATNRERRPPRRNRRNPLRATPYRDHAAGPPCGVAVNGIRPSLSRKPVDLPERNPFHKHSRAQRGEEPSKFWLTATTRLELSVLSGAIPAPEPYGKIVGHDTLAWTAFGKSERAVQVSLTL